MDFGVLPVKKSKRMTEDMVLSDSVSGVSRSGRIRKKSAKLMEMEDFHSPFYDSETTTDPQKSRKKSGGKVMSPTSTSNNLNCTSPLPPLNTSDIRTGAKRKPAPQTTPPLRGMPSTMLSPNSKQTLSSAPLSKGERVITIKQPIPPTPSFEALSGNAYLIGEDIHIITGEPVDSDTDANETDSESPLSPLKIDVGSTDESRVSLHEESGLKMKFILSPKTSKVETPGKGGTANSQRKRGGTSTVRPTSKKTPGTSSVIAKKSQALGEAQGRSTLALLASGGIDPDDSNLEMDSSDEDQIEDKLVIAEPKHAHLSDKSKKRTFGHGIVIGNISTMKSRKKIGKTTTVGHLSINSSSVLGDATGQQQSVYMKEKNSAKKKAVRKIVKPKEKPERKRELSAYMLWCRDYRKVVVSENPGMDFAAISRRLGEIWKSLPEVEKMNWKGRGGKPSPTITTGKVIDSEKKSPAKLSGTKQHDAHSSQEVHRPIGTSPLDVAAYLKLLGESLSIIGQRLTEHEGQIAVSGSLSVLLDSTLCALGPLLCLTSEVQQLDGCPKDTQQSILDNIAYIMPGL